jgi:iron complex outermembrane receptor protein
VPALALARPAAAQQTTRLDTVHVTVSSRVDSAANAARTVDVITSRELAARRGQSLAEILGAHLGVDVYTRSPAQADIALRGSSIEQVVVLVNGHRVSDEQAGHYDLDLAVPTDLVDHVEILRGTGSTLYGPNAVGGVINIVTRDRAAFQTARVSAGSFGTLGASLARTGTVNGIGLQAGADYARSDGHRDGTDYKVLQARLGADAPLGPGRLRASAGAGVRDFGADAFYGPYPAYEDTHTSTASLDYDAPLAGRWTVHAGANGRRHIDLFTLIRDNPSVYQNHHDNWQTGGEVVARYAMADNAGLAIGAEGSDARLVSARLGDHQESRSAAYAELHIAGAAGAAFDAGVRGDASSEYGAFLSPSLAASAPVAPRTRVRASIGRGFRAPTWTERFYTDPANIGSPDLQSERFWAGELGLSSAPTSGTRLDVAWYERRADNLIDWARPAGAPDSVPWHTLNVESARYHGIEATAEAMDIGGVDWTVRMSGLSFTPVGAAGYEGKYALRPITRTVGLTAMLPSVHGVEAVVDLLNARRAGEASYGRADVRLAYAWRGTRLTADLRNLTGARYLDASGMPVAPRGLFVGLEWTPPER